MKSRTNQKGFTVLNVLMVFVLLGLLVFGIFQLLWTDSKTIDGVEVECISVAGDKDPAYKYEADVGNAIMGVLGSWTIVLPVLWLADDFVCPVGLKPLAPTSDTPQ